MCGRFTRMASWADVHKWLSLSRVAELPASYNGAPTQQVLVARDHDGEREGLAMRWGLIPSWAKDTKMAQIGNPITDAGNRWLVEVVNQEYQSQ